VTLFDLTDKVVIVTGGNGQLGRQYSQTLLDQGAKVAIFDLGEPQSPLVGVLYAVVDITNKASIEAGLQQVIDQLGVPHGLINNAAIDSPPNAPSEETGPFETYPESSWDVVLEVNLKGTFLCCQVIGAKMAEAGRGSIINVCSTYGILSPRQNIYEYRRVDTGIPFFKPVAYSASKSGILNLTRYIATYWARQGVRCNTLTIAGVFNNQDKRFLEGYTSNIPIGRMANQDEYNGTILYLLSNASTYMTGSNLVIDGGWSAW